VKALRRVMTLRVTTIEEEGEYTEEEGDNTEEEVNRVEVSLNVLLEYLS